MNCPAPPTQSGSGFASSTEATSDLRAREDHGFDGPACRWSNFMSRSPRPALSPSGCAVRIRRTKGWGAGMSPPAPRRGAHHVSAPAVRSHRSPTCTFLSCQGPCPGDGGRMALLESGSFPTRFMVNDSSNFSRFWKLCFRHSQQAKVQLLVGCNGFRRVTALSPDSTQRARCSEISPHEFRSRKAGALRCTRACPVALQGRPRGSWRKRIFPLSWGNSPDSTRAQNCPQASGLKSSEGEVLDGEDSGAGTVLF